MGTTGTMRQNGKRRKSGGGPLSSGNAGFDLGWRIFMALALVLSYIGFVHWSHGYVTSPAPILLLCASIRTGGQ